MGYGLIPPGLRSGYWRIRFGVAGRRVELSTGTTNEGEARNRAPALIREELTPTPSRPGPAAWDEAPAELATLPHMRPATLKGYEKAVRALREVVPSTGGRNRERF